MKCVAGLRGEMCCRLHGVYHMENSYEFLLVEAYQRNASALLAILACTATFLHVCVCVQSTEFKGMK